MAAPLTIRQGEDCTIVVGSIVDGSGAALDVTGWTVRAMARPSAESSVLWADWTSGTTAGTQGEAVNTGTTISLAIPAVTSSAWTWTRRTGVLQVEITEPSGQHRVARVADTAVYLDPEAVR